ncbi:hypothetical protein CAEBREN_20688 [Caenorhabditis brenneri]|uniref:CUB-like domain-containing protein n=1 Tax=Caenorhabditis brenneri TaxID=135651 RepID=G0NQS2_CAEBE|nr:hypothetical protein CAEBREN_20688 [Caenorhabditis brenneri]
MTFFIFLILFSTTIFSVNAQAPDNTNPTYSTLRVNQSDTLPFLQSPEEYSYTTITADTRVSMTVISPAYDFYYCLLRGILIFDGPDINSPCLGTAYDIYTGQTQFVSTGNQMTIQSLLREDAPILPMILYQDYSNTKDIVQFQGVFCPSAVYCGLYPMDASNGPVALQTIYSSNYLELDVLTDFNGFGTLDVFLGGVTKDKRNSIAVYKHTYIRTSGHQEIHSARHLDIQTSGHRDIRTSEHPDIRTSGHTGTRASGQTGIWTSGHTDRIQTYRHTDIRTYRHLDLRIYRHPDIQTSGHTDIQTAGHPDSAATSATYLPQLFSGPLKTYVLLNGKATLNLTRDYGEFGNTKSFGRKGFIASTFYGQMPTGQHAFGEIYAPIGYTEASFKLKIGSIDMTGQTVFWIDAWQNGTETFDETYNSTVLPDTKNAYSLHGDHFRAYYDTDRSATNGCFMRFEVNPPTP